MGFNPAKPMDMKKYRGFKRIINPLEEKLELYVHEEWILGYPPMGSPLHQETWTLKDQPSFSLQHSEEWSS